MSIFTDLEKDAASVDGFVNENALITTRRNGPKPSWQYIVDQVYGQLGYAVVGSFVDGFTYTGIRQVGVDASGNTWIYTGGQQNLPHVVPAGTVPSAPDYFQVSVNSADNVVLDNGENLQQAIDRLNSEIDEVQEYIDGQQFENIDAVKNYPALSALIGYRIKTKEYHAGTGYGGASYEVVNSGSVTPNDIDIIQGVADSGAAITLIVGERMLISQFGAISGQDSTESINAASKYDIGNLAVDYDYRFSDIDINTNTTYSGNGSLVGGDVGEKPSVASMRSGDSTDRLDFLMVYNPSSVNFISDSPLRGFLSLKNALLLSDQDQITATENLYLESCSMHGCSFRAFLNNAVINAPYLIVSDSIEDGVFVQRGGQVYMPFGEIYNSGKRGCHLQLSGFLEIQDGGVYDSEEEQVFSSGKTEVVAKRTTLDGGNNIGFLMIYGGSGDLIGSAITNNQGAALVVESNSAVLAESSTITGNGISGAFGDGVSTSYGGFAQVRYSTITGNGGYACATRTGGEIQAQGCIVDKTNNSGDVQFLAQVNGRIILDEMGDANTPTLTNTDCFPVWGMVGSGLSFCGRDNGVAQSETGYSMSKLNFGRRGIETISGGSIDIKYMYNRVSSEGGAAADDLETIARSEDDPTDICYIQPFNNGEIITIKNGVGNIVTSDGVDIVLDAKNRLAMFIWNSDTQRWMGRVI